MLMGFVSLILSYCYVVMMVERFFESNIVICCMT